MLQSGFQVEWAGITAGLAAAVATSTLMTFFVRAIVDKAIGDLRRELRDPNVGFVPRETCTLQHAQSQGFFKIQEDRLADMQKEAAILKQRLTDEVVGLQLSVRGLEGNMNRLVGRMDSEPRTQTGD